MDQQPTTQRRRGRGRPVSDRIRRATDKQLLDWLENGIEKWTGHLDAAGNPIMVRTSLSATHMAQVLKRLGQISREPVTPRSLLDRAAARGFGSQTVKFPGTQAPDPGEEA